MNSFNVHSGENITSAEELRVLVGAPHEAVVKKSIAQIDDHILNYISKSPLFFLSTSNAEGRCDVSPRGDSPGFVHVLDDQTLTYPELNGNRRIDSMLNIVSNPYIGMLFLIPGMEEVLRINGRASIFRKGKLLEQTQEKGITPLLTVLVKVEECFIHCPRALKSSAIWETETWLDKEQLPSRKEMFYAHLKINGMTLK